MSDEEKRMRDGSHEIFRNDENPSGVAEPDADTATTDVAVESGTAGSGAESEESAADGFFGTGYQDALGWKYIVILLDYGL